MDNVDQKKHSRVDAIKSWGRIGFNIGWDLGQGVTLFIPMGLLRPLKKMTPQKSTTRGTRKTKQKIWWQSLSLAEKLNYSAKNGVKYGLLTPAIYLANYIVSPVLGAVVGVIALAIGLIGGGIFNQLIVNTDYRYAMQVVEEHSATAVWGAIGMGALLTYTALGGGVTLPGFTALGVSISPYLSNFLLPLLAAYSIMICLSAGQAVDRVYDISRIFAFHIGNTQKWDFHLSSLIKVKLKNPELEERTSKQLQEETKQMASRYHAVEEELRQMHERDPYKSELDQKGVLNQYALQREQLAFIDQLAALDDPSAKAALLDQRKVEFGQRLSRV